MGCHKLCTLKSEREPPIAGQGRCQAAMKLWGRKQAQVQRHQRLFRAPSGCCPSHACQPSAMSTLACDLPPPQPPSQPPAARNASSCPSKSCWAPSCRWRRPSSAGLPTVRLGNTTRRTACRRVQAALPKRPCLEPVRSSSAQHTAGCPCMSELLFGCMFFQVFACHQSMSVVPSLHLSAIWSFRAIVQAF